MKITENFLRFFFPPLSHLAPFCELPDVRQDWRRTAGEMLVFCGTNMRMGALESALKGVREAKILPLSPLFIDLFCGKEIKQTLLPLLFNQCLLSPDSKPAWQVEEWKLTEKLDVSTNYPQFHPFLWGSWKAFRFLIQNFEAPFINTQPLGSL